MGAVNGEMRSTAIEAATVLWSSSAPMTLFPMLFFFPLAAAVADRDADIMPVDTRWSTSPAVLYEGLGHLVDFRGTLRPGELPGA
mgnify:CR=1 FL=1